MIEKINRQLFSLFGLLLASTALYSAHVDLDPTFGPSHNGIVTTDIGDVDTASSIKIYDNKLIVTGTSDNSFATVRYNLDGTLDTSFGTGGTVVTPHRRRRFSNVIGYSAFRWKTCCWRYSFSKWYK